MNKAIEEITKDICETKGIKRIFVFMETEQDNKEIVIIIGTDNLPSEDGGLRCFVKVSHEDFLITGPGAYLEGMMVKFDEINNRNADVKNN